MFFLNSFSKNHIPKDSLSSNVKKRHSPRKAGLYSLILPGLGQVYNKHYIKIPLIYALGGLTLGIALKRNSEYRLFKTVNDRNIKGEDYSEFNAKLLELGQDNPSLFKTNRDAARSSRDLFYVYTGLVYLLNIMDALVSAHLKEFTVSDDLSLQVQPTILVQNRKASSGLALIFNF